mgnify:CR=1 FL=1
MTGHLMAAQLRKAKRHLLWRWSGAPLLVTGGLLVCLAFWALIRGGPGFPVMLGLLGVGMALAAFGANHDTSMALAFELRQAASELPEEGNAARLLAELDEELVRDRDSVLALQATPRIALALPWMAIAVQSTTAIWLFDVLGWLRG